MELSIIIPAYMEEENLRKILPRINSVLRGMGVEHEILVVDTIEQMDETKRVSEENGASYINRENGDSYGDAVRTGIKRAVGRYILFMDADGSHSPEFIEHLYEHKDGNDIAIASRYIEGGNTDNNKILILMSLLVNMIYSRFLHIGCHDVSNSFKLYRGQLIKELDLTSNNFDIVEEILVKLARNNGPLKIKEIPYSFKKRMFGNTKRNLFLFIISYIVTLLRLKFIK